MAAPDDPLLGHGETILLIEDNEDVRDANASVLQVLGYRTLLAHTAESALELWEQRRDEVALVLTDLRLPGMGGLDMFRILRDRGATIPVIVLSGYPMDDPSLRTQVAWLQKPCEIEHLAATVRRLLDRG